MYNLMTYDTNNTRHRLGLATAASYKNLTPADRGHTVSSKGDENACIIISRVNSRCGRVRQRRNRVQYR